MILAATHPVLAATDPTSSALSQFATALRVPVHIGALLLLVALAFELGRTAIEAWRRISPRTGPLQQTVLRAMDDPGDAPQIARAAPGALSERAVLDLATATQSTTEDAVENALADYELRVQRRLDRTRILVRAGPAFGLMGTLIPLAPGLAQLGQGNFGALAGDLKVAFAATVVGILVGTAAFALTLIRTRVYTEDLAGLERAVAVRGAVRGAAHGAAHNRIPQAVGAHAT